MRSTATFAATAATATATATATASLCGRGGDDHGSDGLSHREHGLKRPYVSLSLSLSLSYCARIPIADVCVYCTVHVTSAGIPLRWKTQSGSGCKRGDCVACRQDQHQRQTATRPTTRTFGFLGRPIP